MRPNILSIAVAVTLALVPSHVFAWNALGHKVIADIAWGNISMQSNPQS